MIQLFGGMSFFKCQFQSSLVALLNGNLEIQICLSKCVCTNKNIDVVSSFIIYKLFSMYCDYCANVHNYFQRKWREF